MVHERFQQAFHSLIDQVDDWSPYLDGRTIHLGGHSLGGAFSIFMQVHLWEVYGRVAFMNLGLAGPFIVDDAFTYVHQYPLRYLTAGTWWQVKVVDNNTPGNIDGTVEGYQVASREKIFIEEDAICSFPINPLPVPQKAMGCTTSSSTVSS